MMENIKEYVLKKKVLMKEELLSMSKKPKLVIVQVNEDPASNAYIKGKLKDMDEIGADKELIKLDINTTQDELLKLIDKLNKDVGITGFIVQMPLPKQIDEEIVKRSIDPKKDVDGFNPLSKYDPATPKGIVTYLEDQKYTFKSRNAVVIGRSNIVGRPMQKMLLDRDMNVTILHSKTCEADKKFYIEHADLIVIAIGKKWYLDNSYNFKKGCVVMDVGINRSEDNHLYGDCVPDLNVEFQSPVPGGCGLLTRLALSINLMEVFKDGF